MHLVL